MASSPMNLDRPPAQPPEVAQSSPNAGMSSMFQRQLAERQQQQAQPGGGGDGKLQMLGEAVKRGIAEMQKDPGFAPYAERMLTIMDQGLKAVGGPSPAPTGAAPAQPGAPATPQGASGFPG